MTNNQIVAPAELRLTDHQATGACDVTYINKREKGTRFFVGFKSDKNDHRNPEINPSQDI